MEMNQAGSSQTRHNIGCKTGQNWCLKNETIATYKYKKYGDIGLAAKLILANEEVEKIKRQILRKKIVLNSNNKNSNIEIQG